MSGNTLTVRTQQGTLTTVNLLDNGATRRWRYDGTLTLDATAWDNLGGLTSYNGGVSPIVRNIYVVGVDANGRVGLVSQPIMVTVKE